MYIGETSKAEEVEFVFTHMHHCPAKGELTSKTPVWN